MRKIPQRVDQSGVMLLEALIAILIFSIGILGIVGLQGTAVKQATDARFRSDASILANQLFGTMWLGDRNVATMQAQFNTGNAGYNTWKTTVVGTLPGAAANPPSVAVDANGVVTVTVRWLAPSEPAGTAAHQYVAIAQIR